jgi:GT2 family glycosyltransferase
MAVGDPSVLVVLVVKDGARWLRHSLLGLSRQTHRRLGVLAVDNASSDGSGSLLEQALGAGRVIRLQENLGFAGAVKEALGSPMAADADYVMLMHDDTVLAPDAIARLVDAAERIEGAGVVGPKVLDWEQPRLLRDIGMSTDRFGSPYSPLEEGEIDQGQYDRIREVLFVSSCAMLVAKRVWNRIGPPDERYFTHDEDLDFCWRARLAGFRILVTPIAEARHRGATLRAERPGSPPDSLLRYHRERSSLASILKNYGLRSLVWVLPSYATAGFMRLLLYVVGRRFEDAGQVLAAWGWNIAHLPGTIRRRRRAQAVREVPDRDVRRFMAPAGDRLRRLAGAVRQALFPARTEGALEPEEEEAPKVAFRVNLARFAAAHPVASAWVLAALVATVAYRNILWAPTLAGGALPAFPESAFDFFRELGSGLQHTALGGTQQASPALGFLGLGSILTLGSPALLQKVLLVVLPGVAGAGCYRAIRSLTEGKLPAVIGAAAFALSPLVLWSISEGRISALVFLAGLPWLAAKVIDGFREEARPRRGRWIVGFALGLATLVAFYPGAALAAALLIGVSWLLPPLGAGRLRGGGLALAGVTTAALLAFPVALALARGRGSGLADVVGSPSVASVIRLSLAPGPGAWVVAFAIPVAAVLGLMYVTGPGARIAAWAALAALCSIVLAWLAGAGHLPLAVANPVAYASVAAFAYALLLALGLASVVPGVARHAFGARHLAAGILGLALAAGLVGQSAEAAKASWRIGSAEDVLPDAYPVVATSAGPAFRVLWVGRWDGGALSSPAGVPQGRVEAGKASIRYAVGDPAGASILDVGRPPAGPGFERLEDALAAIFSGDSRHGGTLLAPFGVRVVVADPSDVTGPMMKRLKAQLDIDSQPAGDLLVFRTAHPVRLASVIPDPEWLVVARRPSFAGLASLPAARSRLLAEPPVPAPTPLPPEALAYLAQQFDERWRAEAGGGTEAPFRAFGWAVGFAVESDSAVEVGYQGQLARNGEVLALALLWLGALWITRRPATRG